MCVERGLARRGKVHGQDRFADTVQPKQLHSRSPPSKRHVSDCLFDFGTFFEVWNLASKFFVARTCQNIHCAFRTVWNRAAAGALSSAAICRGPLFRLLYILMRRSFGELEGACREVRIFCCLGRRGKESCLMGQAFVNG